MALLRWIHLRKLVSIEDLIAGTASGKTALPKPPVTTRPKAAPLELGAPRAYFNDDLPNTARPEHAEAAKRAPVAASTSDLARPRSAEAPEQHPSSASASSASSGSSASSSAPSASSSSYKDAFLAEIRKTKFVFYNTVVAQAQTIEVTADGVTFSFSPSQRALCANCEQNRAWLESTAEKITGRKVRVTAMQIEASTASSPGSASDAASSRKTALRDQALADAGVPLLEVFPAEIRDVEEM
jgi:hypothetical protein